MGDKYIDKDFLTLSQLRQMEVIEISEGKRLGFISDIVLDDNLNGIESIIIPPIGGFFSFFRRKDEMKIKWEQIKVFGVDIVLVDLSGSRSKEANKNSNQYQEEESN